MVGDDGSWCVLDCIGKSTRASEIGDSTSTNHMAESDLGGAFNVGISLIAFSSGPLLLKTKKDLCGNNLKPYVFLKDWFIFSYFADRCGDRP